MVKKQAAKRWILMGDMHVGASTGLLPDCEELDSFAIPKKVNERYKDCIQCLGPRPNVVVCNGDAVDGHDKKGRDVIIGEVTRQAELAAQAIAMWEATDEYIIVQGTHYHTSLDGESMEELVAAHLRSMTGVKVSYRRKLKTTINGWFRLEGRHKVGRSSIPHGRATPGLRSQMWNTINAALDSSMSGKPAKLPHLMFYSHVHYYNRAENDFGTVITLPCWQALGSKYGDEQCDGHVSMGAIALDVEASEDDGWNLERRSYPAGVVDRWEHR